MATTTAVLSAVVFERKSELGGGYRARVRRNATQVIEDGPVFQTKQEGINWARHKVHELMGGIPWRPGYIYKPDWIMHAWVAA